MQKDENRKAIDAIVDESDKRYNQIYGKHNQYTGYLMELHTNRCTITDMGNLRTQYLTDEVYNNELYQEVMKAGSIRKYVEQVNELYKDDPTIDALTYDIVYELLILARLQRDPSFAFYCLFQIAYKRGGVGPFELNYPQRIMLKELEEMRTSGMPIRIILLKARQWGGSTLVQLYMAWMQLFVCEQWNSIIIAQVKDTAKTIKAMYTKVLEMFPAVVFGSAIQFSPFEKSQDEYIITDAKKNVVRDNRIGVGSYEKFAGLRGHPYHLAHFSEVAYWRSTPGKTAQEVVTNVNGGFDDIANTLIVMESTACGNSGFFYEQYELAKDPEIDTLFKAVFIPFYYIERDMKEFKGHWDKWKFAKEIYDNRLKTEAPDKAHESGAYIWSLWEKGACLESINWYITKRSTFTDFAQMASEAPSDDEECFTYAGTRLFSVKWVETMRAKYVREPMWIGDIIYTGHEGNYSSPPHLSPKSDGSFRIWKKPDKIRAKNRYMVVVDPGGRNQRSSDPNVITVIDRLPLMLSGGKVEVVARWRGWIRYDDLAEKAIAVAQFYNDALLVFESNTYDKKKSQAAEFTEEDDHIEGILNVARQKYRHLYMRKTTSKEDIRNGILTKVGFQTNHTTKTDMIDTFVVLFEDDLWIDPDDRFYIEATLYEKKEDGTWGNMEGAGNHDDILMTDMIASLVSRDTPVPEIERKISNDDYNDYGTINESSF